jgi:ornithine carbamoyltransferase
MRHFLDLWRHDAAKLRVILDDAHARKAARGQRRHGEPDDDLPARGAVMAMVFEKNSTRTRFSFDGAMRQLGGDALIVSAGDMQLGRGESIADTARTLSQYVDLAMLRTNSHDDLEAFAAASAVPVINGLTDRSHPCQIMADLQAFEEVRGPVAGKTLAWLGDGNNVCASFIHAAPRFGFTLRIASPAAYQPNAEDIARAVAEGGEIELLEQLDDPRAAADGADAVITDCWVSMGDADEAARRAAHQPFQVNAAVMAAAAPDAVFMHCLPAHRGEEVTDEVIDGPASIVWREAANRLHAQKAVIAWCLGAGTQ